MPHEEDGSRAADDVATRTFVVYEIWTRHRVVQAASMDEALKNEPDPVAGFSLANLHGVEVPACSPERLRLVEKK